MFKSSRKKLIAIGCSFTEDCNSFSPWPTHLAEKLDMDCVNLGKSGSGNEQILSKILDTVLTEKNIGLVVVMWSGWQRVDFQIIDSRWITLNPAWNSVKFKKKINQIELTQVEITAAGLLEINTPHHAVQSTLRSFIYAENLLKDIPHLYIQGVAPITRYHGQGLGSDGSIRVAMKSFIDSHYSDYVDKHISNKFIGWPCFSRLNGYCINDLLNNIDPEKKELRLSDKLHPNEQGHKYMAKVILDGYEKYNIMR